MKIFKARPGANYVAKNKLSPRDVLIREVKIGIDYQHEDVLYGLTTKRCVLWLNNKNTGDKLKHFTLRKLGWNQHTLVSRDFLTRLRGSQYAKFFVVSFKVKQ